MTERVKISRTPEAVPKTGSYKVEFSDGQPSVYFYYDDEPSRRLRPETMTSEQALEAARGFAREKQATPQIEVYTARYEREHGHKPAGRRFWCFTIVSPTVTVKDYFLNIGEAMPYQKALDNAMEVAKLRRSERIIVEP